MLRWILANKEWLFSGIGITVLSGCALIAGWARNKSFRKGPPKTTLWDATRVLQGHWEGSAIEHPLYSKEQNGFAITWDFEIKADSIKATSTARGTVDGTYYTDTYHLVGDFVQDRFFRLHYQNDNKDELSFGSEVIEVNLDGKRFSGVYVGLSSTRERIVSGVLEARKIR